MVPKEVNVMERHLPGICSGSGRMDGGVLMRLLYGTRKSVTGKVCFLFLLSLMGIPIAMSCAGQTVQEGGPLTLKQAIEIALKNHPSIEAQQGQVASGKAKTGQARGNYYPQLSIGGAYSRIWPVNASTSATTSLAGLPPGGHIPSGISPEARSYEQYAATANLSQLLLDFGKTGAQVRVQKLNTQAARYELQNIRDQVVFNVRQAYYALLSAQDNHDVMVEAMEQFRKHLEYAQVLFETGSKPKFDVTKAEVDLSNAELDLIKAENSVRLARATLNNAMGLPPSVSYSVEEDLSLETNPRSLQEALETAFSRRPDLLALQKQKESAQESIKVADRGYFPVVSGNASLTYVGTEFPMDHGWVAGANIVFPVFSGFITSYQVAEARGNLVTASANVRNLKQAVVLELEQGFLSLREADQRMRSSETAMKQAKENLELASERYAAGLAIGVEVTDAVVSYANAKMSNIAARYDYKTAKARIDKAIGQR